MGGMKDLKELLKKLSQEEPSKQVVNTLIALVHELRDEIKRLHDELAKLKKLPPKPTIKPSNLEKKQCSEEKKDRKENWSKESKNSKLVVDEEIKINVDAKEKSTGAVFKGYKEYIVQNIVIAKKVTKYCLEQWQNPDGTYVTANLPKEVSGSHFGPGLRQYILHQSTANRVTQNRILSDLKDKGIEISAGQIDSIIKSEAEKLDAEAKQILSVGMKSGQLQVDDTGGRHKGKNSFTTVICNDYFTFFKSTDCKSRINFLEILHADNVEYRITSETLDYIHSFKLAKSTICLVQNNLDQHFENKGAWEAFLSKHMLGKGTQRLLTQGALIGALLFKEAISLDTILMSDGAGQFNLFKHVLCWIHIERSIKKLVPLNDEDRQDIDFVLDQFWNFYRKLKEFQGSPTDKQTPLKQHLSDKFDQIFSYQATEIPLAQALKKIRDRKQELLRVLDCPTIPLHNNTSECDVREYVTKRKISGGTRSDQGRKTRDILTTLYKTCKKLSISFWDFLVDRISQTSQLPHLSELIKQKIAAASAQGP
jgi:hypothetical protein